MDVSTGSAGSKTGVISWSFDPAGATVSVSSQSGWTPVSEWAFLKLETDAGHPAALSLLLRLLADDEAAEASDDSVEVGHSAIASLSVAEGRILGLPARIDWPLVIDIPDLPVRPNVTAAWRLEGRYGRPLRAGDRRGCIVRIDEEDRRLSKAALDVIEALENFNSTAGQPSESRLLAWSRVAECLPDDTRVPEAFGQIRVLEVTGFSLQPFVNESGEADFDPVPGTWTYQETAEDSDQPGKLEFDARLPRTPSVKFAERFRRLGSRRAYPLDAGWYAAVPGELVPVLAEVRKLQKGSASERLEFLRQPEAVLRDHLPDIPEGILHGVFASDDYSARVVGTGIWKPPVLPWVRREPENWLPEERLGIRIEDKHIAVRPEDVSDLLEQLLTGRHEGKAFVEYGGANIPTTDEAIEAVSQLAGLIGPDRNPASDSKEDGGSNSPARLVLQVAENFTVVDYARAARIDRAGVDLDINSQSIGLRNQPLPHQQQAIRWLQKHWAKGSPGALLADDMGLGKTFQSLVFLTWLRREMAAGRIARRPFLVVAPTALLENWVAECERHIGEDGLGPLIRLYGNELRSLRTSAGRELEIGIHLLDLAALRDAGWVLTTYETLRDYQHSLARIHFAAAAFDETQKAKNPQSAISQAVKTVHADFTLCITGTPVENRMADLWNILDLARPGELDTLKSFSARYEASADSGEHRLGELKTHLTESDPAVMLRRMKKDHLQGLPGREDYFLEEPMPRPQREAYQDALTAAQSAAGSADAPAMLETLGRLRTVSLHPFLHDGGSDEAYIAASARLIQTFQVLDRIRDCGERALIFVESRDLQGTLAMMIQRRYRLAEAPMIINGAVSGPNRIRKVNSFQAKKGFDVMILSPRAGGVGLTLTAANHVIHLSRWWNPAVEDQCTDRVYRIGQRRPVHVYHPMAVHPDLCSASFDLILNGLLDRKRKMSRHVLAPTTFLDRDREEMFTAVVGTYNNSNGAASVDLRAVDLLEPLEFERWVGDRFRQRGYQVNLTPFTGDAGVDLIAAPSTSSARPTVLVQCKHTQVDARIETEAVRALLDGSARYDVGGGIQLMVVTNASQFAEGARALARASDVRLISRAGLREL